MATKTSYLLCYSGRSLRDPEGISLFGAQKLTKREYELLADGYSRVRDAQQPPMIRVLEDLKVSWSALQKEAIRHASTNEQKAHDLLVSGARITAFAAANAVYSFQEHAETGIKRTPSPGAWKSANSCFADIYAQRPYYLLAYKLRRVLTHISIDTINARISNSGTGTQPRSANCTFLRNPLLADITGSIAKWLRELPEDPSLDDLLRESLEGAREVYSDIRQHLFPREQGDLENLSKFRHLVLNPNHPVCLTQYTKHGSRSGPAKFIELDPKTLLAAGMKPLSSLEKKTSEAHALSVLGPPSIYERTPFLLSPTVTPTPYRFGPHAREN